MAKYDLVIRHKPGMVNRADYLSRSLGVDRLVKNNKNVTVLPDQQFTRALNLEDLDQEVQQSQGKLSEEWKEQYGLINSEEGWTRQDQLAVGDTPELHRCLVAAHHNHAMAGHPGIQCMISLVSRRYWWPGLREFVRNYVKGCTTCQATKAGMTKPRVPLFPIMCHIFLPHPYPLILFPCSPSLVCPLTLFISPLLPLFYFLPPFLPI